MEEAGVKEEKKDSLGRVEEEEEGLPEREGPRAVAVNTAVKVADPPE